MLVILDPPGNTPIFLAVTQRLSQKERNRAAFLAVGTAFLVISMFAIGGQTILDYLHVSVPAVVGADGDSGDAGGIVSEALRSEGVCGGGGGDGGWAGGGECDSEH